ncbi:nitrile hydratase subunit alpha [Streptomyces sp. NBC_01530]|uniref:nitrile hydratase subunit alpha n=1 Tax=Streptomyces sp. NBC_01530 TaxID=2903895 RepID=UPI00386BA7BC
MVREPRTAPAEFALEPPDTTEITVWDSSAETRYMVLPRRFRRARTARGRNSRPHSSPVTR